MLKILMNFVFILILRLKGVNASLFAFFENTRNIKIGDGTVIDHLSIVRGGEKNSKIIIGNNSRIRRNVYISATQGEIDIGSHVLIAHNCWIAGRGKIIIGNNTLIGPNVVIASSNHDLSKVDIPLMDVPEIPGTIIIGSNCWIGANSTIVPDVTIGDDCVIAAGSVVIDDVASGVRVAGNPAKCYKPRVEDEKHLYITTSVDSKHQNIERCN